MHGLTVALVAGAVLFGCGEEADERDDPNGAAVSTSVVRDAELVGILQATIAASSAMADAGERAQNANVRGLVYFQGTNARNARVNVARIAAELGITAEPSAFATEIASASTRQMATLATTADTGFDDAFLVSVADAQEFNAATFASNFAGSGSGRVAALVDGMQRALELEASYSRALQGDFDASDFLREHQEIAGTTGASGGAGGGNGSGNSGTTAPGPSTGTDAGTGSGTGTGHGSGNTGGIDDPNSGGIGTSPGSGSGSDGGLGGEGTATGEGQDPGGAVGTGNPDDDGDLSQP